MSDTKKHTPTPWAVMPDGRARVNLVHVETSAENKAGAGLPVCSIPTAREADADLIVEAVNSHDSYLALKAAAAEVLSVLGPVDGYDGKSFRALNALREALEACK